MVPSRSTRGVTTPAKGFASLGFRVYSFRIVALGYGISGLGFQPVLGVEALGILG